MNKMRYILTVVLALSATILFAQQRSQMSTEERAKQLDTMIFDNVEGLKKKQKVAITEANVVMVNKQVELRENGNREGMREKMGEIREAYTSEMKEILNEEQYAQFQKVMEERMQRRRSPGQ